MSGHSLRTWSSTQSVVVTSSAEAELHNVVARASRGLGLAVDASRNGSTSGLGRVGHLEVMDLSLQALG